MLRTQTASISLLMESLEEGVMEGLSERIAINGSAVVQITDQCCFNTLLVNEVRFLGLN